MLTAFDVALELWDETIRLGGTLSYGCAVAHLIALGGQGTPWVIGTRLHPAVVEEFLHLTRTEAVWSRSLRGWRYRQAGDPPMPARGVA